MDFSNDEPKNREEAKLIADFAQIIQDIMDIDSLIEVGQKVLQGYELNNIIKQLDAFGFWPFVAQETRKLTGGVKKAPENFIVLLLRVVRKSSKEIIRLE